MNERPVLCLREGAILRVEGASATIKGTAGGLLLRKGEDPAALAPGDDVSFLLAQPG